jgi:single-stranded DNA-binding protein
MNKVCISGRLTHDPIFKSYSEQTQLTTIFIANNIYYGENQKTGFFKVKAWGNMAKIIAEHCKVGTKLFITGKLEQHQYED